MRRAVTILLSLTFLFNGSFAQEKDHKMCTAADSCQHPLSKPENLKYKTKLPRDLILPGILIGYGLTTINGNGLYSSFEARNDIQRLFKGKGSRIDDFLIFSPYVEFAALTLAKVKCRNDLVNTGLLILKSQLIMSAIVFPMKQLTQIERPYSRYDTEKTAAEREKEKSERANTFQSLPSGHTAQAFVAAAIVNKEFRYKSPWPGIAAYTLASTVGFYRMVNDRHWMSDVLVGAGIGILSANIAYGTHKFKWGTKQICIVPTVDSKTKGFAMVTRF